MKNSTSPGSFLRSRCVRSLPVLAITGLAWLSLPSHRSQALTVYSDFEVDSKTAGFYSDTFDWKTRQGTNRLTYAVTDDGPGTNRYGKVHALSGATNEFLYSEPLDGPIAFSSSKLSITMQVRAGSAVTAKLMMTVLDSSNPIGLNQFNSAPVTVNATQTFQLVTFTFPSAVIGKNLDQLRIYFDYTGTGTNWWSFDDVTGPQTIPPQTAISRVVYGGSTPDGLFLKRQMDDTLWYGSHVANATIMRPNETKNNTWRMYVRGSGQRDAQQKLHSSIGLFTATPSDNFDPRVVGGIGGPGWTEYGHNPVLQYGGAITWYDKDHATNPVAFEGDNGSVVLYYVGKIDTGVGEGDKYVCGARAYDDPGVDFHKFDTIYPPFPPYHVNSNPLPDLGAITAAANIASYFYTFHHGDHGDGTEHQGGSRIWLSKGDQSGYINNGKLIVDLGLTGEYDSQSVSCARLFKLPSDTAHPSRYYLVYACSDHYTDYPDRFNIALTDNLQNPNLAWYKVKSPTVPIFFRRGNIGQWDQGGIWTSDVTELNTYNSVFPEATVVMYYEGWGKQGSMDDRNELYAPPGHSQLGLATMKTADFLAWIAADPNAPR